MSIARFFCSFRSKQPIFCHSLLCGLPFSATNDFDFLRNIFFVLWIVGKGNNDEQIWNNCKIWVSRRWTLNFFSIIDIKSRFIEAWNWLYVGVELYYKKYMNSNQNFCLLRFSWQSKVSSSLQFELQKYFRHRHHWQANYEIWKDLNCTLISCWFYLLVFHSLCLLFKIFFVRNFIAAYISHTSQIVCIFVQIHMEKFCCRFSAADPIFQYISCAEEWSTTFIWIEIFLRFLKLHEKLEFQLWLISNKIWDNLKNF